MKKLTDILTNVDVLELKGTLDIKIREITFDSRMVKQGCLFVAIPGTQVDGHEYIEQAILNGALVIVCQSFPDKIPSGVSFLKVKNSASALGKIVANYFGNPSENLTLIGITGTNGKTTTATLLYKLFTALGYKAGLISTISNKVGIKDFPATHTTPDSIQIQKMLGEMLKEGCEHVFMEVSSHAIEQDRIAGLTFAGAVFTNISHDHLDYHLTFKNYLASKKKLFDQLQTEAIAISNTDDKNGKIILQNTKAKKYTFGIKNLADFKGKVIENHFSGMQMIINDHELHTLLTGIFNAYNLLATYAVAILLEQDKDEVLTVLSRLTGAEGRFELVRSQNSVTGIIDYAHSPDALHNVLDSINALRTQNEKLITVVGAGGDRDREKRPKMARIASTLSNLLILTSDNPRSEDPEEILKEMKQGIEADRVNKTISITNRKEAIKTAVTMANPGDVILIAGKGHEKYQEIKGVKYPFDDKKVLTEFLENT